MAPDQKESTQPIMDRPIKSVRIYSYPKIIFIWPTMVFALICGIGMSILGLEEPVARPPEPTPDQEQAQVDEAPAEGGEAVAEAGAKEAEAEEPPPRVYRFSSWRNIFGVIFLLVFAVNMLVMALDFPRFTIIAGVLGLTTLAFLLLYLASLGIDFLSPLTFLSRHMYFVANSGFYFAIAIILAIMFGIIWSTRILDYWEVRANEILHHHGPLSDLERYPTIQLKFDKEIPDILEYLLGLGSGRLVLYFGADQRYVVLDHVLFINAKEDALKRLMGQLQVQIMQQEQSGLGGDQS